jgi:hypothetical protein
LTASPDISSAFVATSSRHVDGSPFRGASANDLSGMQPENIFSPEC